MSQTANRSIPRVPIALLLGLISFSAYALTAAMTEIPGQIELWAMFAGFSVWDWIQWSVLPAVLVLLYALWLKLPEPFFGAPLWLLSLFFAVMITCGKSYLLSGAMELVTGNKALSLLSVVGRAVLYFAVMKLLCAALAKRGPVGGKRGRSLWLGGGLLLCWIPWLIYIFPGTVSNDSVTQVMEIIGVEPLGNANPIFQTALVYLFRGIGVALNSADAGVFLYCGLQALLLAWLMGGLLADMARDGAPRWLRYLSFAFYALCPVFPLFAFCMGKDTNFSMAVLWLSLSAVRLIRLQPDQRLGAANVISLCLAGVMCTLLRNPGVYLALLTLFMLLCWTLKRPRHRSGQWVAPFGAILSVVLVYASLHLLLIPRLGIAPMPETENWSLPLQQTARVASTHELTHEEAKTIDAVLPIDQLKDVYNPELSDPVKQLWQDGATEAQKSAFFRTWRSLAAKYPSTCLSATFHNTYGYLYPGYMSLIKPTLLIGRQKRSTPEVEAVFDYSVNPRAETLKSFTDQLAQNPLYRIWIAPGLYGWICLFAITVLLRGRRRRLLIAAVPSLFSLAGCLLSAVNGYFRYAMPLYLCAPLLLWLCAQRLCPTEERKVQ
ncbi:MAG: DUF6020 family protein [Eubacteriales bacterium]|nr:DUF6020 family protein [Eubacteriales bacterium]